MYLAFQLATGRAFLGLFGTFRACASLSKPKQECGKVLLTARYILSAMCALVEQVVYGRDAPSEGIALTELWVSTGIFDALEVTGYPWGTN
jgi:hypothetical protein